MEYTSLHHFSGQEGYERVITTENSNLKHLGFSRILLGKGKKIEYIVEDIEMAVVLQKGDFKASVEWKGKKYYDGIKGTREDVFEELPTAIYLPPESKIVIESTNSMEARVFTAPCKEGNKPFFCEPKDVKEGNPGKGIYERKYRFIFGPPSKHNDNITKKLIVGESVSSSGGWIGWPAHKHDFNTDKELNLDEIFSIRVKGPKTGTVIVYSFDFEDGEKGKRWNEFKVIENDNTALALPTGYHTSFATPGSFEYLLWGLAGEEKKYKVQFDERFTGLEDSLY